MVINNGSSALTSIDLRAEIKDGAGNSLIKDNGTIVPDATFPTMLYTLGPGEASPFEYSYDMTNGTPASYLVTVSGQEPGMIKRATLTAENVQLVDDGSGWYYLTGELVNTGSQWAHINSLAGAILDSSNKVLSTDWTATYTTELAPAGGTTGADRTPFEINFPNPGGTGTPPWSLYWDADIVDTASTNPISITITNGYIDQYGAHHVVGWALNSSDQPLNSLVVAGAFDQNNTTLDASYSYLPIPIKAGGSEPFSVTGFGNVNFNPNQSALVRTYSVQADPWSNTPPAYGSVELTTSEEVIQKDGGTWTFDGNVVNSSGQSLSNATVIVSVMDAQNNLVATEFTTVFSNGAAIAPGETNSYSVTINLDPNVDTSGYTTTTAVFGELSQ